MRILYLAPVHPLLTPGNPLPFWQMQSSHIRALCELGHKVTVIPYTPKNKIRVSLFERMVFNIAVVARVVRQLMDNPYQYIFFSLGVDVLLPQTIRLLKYVTGAPLIILSGVSPTLNGNPRDRALAPLADLVVTNDQTHVDQWKQLGAKKAVVLPLSAIDPQIHFSRKVKKNIDVCFIGTMTRERKKFIDELRMRFPKRIKFISKEFVWEEEYINLLSRARVVLNPLRPQMPAGANLRLFEIPACGALQLAQYTKKEWLIPRKEVVIYKNVDGAVKKTLYYLSHQNEMQKIIDRGRRRVTKEHLFIHRFGKLMKIINSL